MGFIGALEVALELQVIGRICEHQIDRTGCHLRHPGKVKIDLIGKFFRARQFLPGALLLTEWKFYISIALSFGRDCRGRLPNCNEEKTPCVTTIFAAVTTSKIAAMTAAVEWAAAVVDSAFRWAAAASVS